MLERYETPSSIDMRKPCGKHGCDCIRGTIMEKGGQDMVICARCNTWRYNAPKTETGRAVRSVSTVHATIKPKLRAKILNRANAKCELCGKASGDCVLHVGHCIPVEIGLRMDMTDDEINHEQNLRCLCDECNLGMGNEPMPLRFMLQTIKAWIVFEELATSH